MKEYREEIVNAIFTNYIVVYEIDLDKDLISLVYKDEGEDLNNFLDEGRYSLINSKYAINQIEKEYSREFERRGAIDNLRRELKEKISFKFSFAGYDGKVRTVEYRRVEALDNDDIGKVLMSFCRLEDDRASAFKLKKERQKHRDLLEEELNKIKEISQSKSRFLSNMSHDLRTPISSMMGYINLANMHLDNRELVEDYLKKISTNCDQLLGIIDDVLSISQIESGRVTVDEQKFSINEVVDEIVSLITPLANKKEQELIVEKSYENDEVLMDKIKVEKILINVLNNAIKYTHRCGKIIFRILAKGDVADGNLGYRFEIEDNGVGIDKSFLERIFEPFERENDREIAQIQGTGLGLSITKEIIKVLDGKIDIQSVKYEGTKVVIDLSFKPFRQDILARYEDFNIRNLRRAEDIANQRTFNKKRFLIVDDNEANLEILSTFLQDLGATIDIATNGMDAIKIISDSDIYQYNAVLMDIKMPILDGDEATKEIRKLDNRTIASIPIIGISANVYPKDKERAMDAGMDAYIVKPVNVDELLRVLKDIML